MNASPPLLRAIMAGGLAITLLACTKNATFRPSKTFVAPGAYTSQQPDASGFSIRLNLNENNTYTKKKMKGACQVFDSRGKWKSDQEVIEFTLQESRRRPDCDAQWEVLQEDRSAERTIRNVTTKSFDMLEEGEQTAAEWIKFIKP